MRTAGDLLGDYQHVIDELTLVTGDSGAFEVVVDGDLVYSKHATGRHAEPGEILGIFDSMVAPGTPRYADQ